MPNIEASAVSVALTTDASDDGVLNLSTTKFFVGAEAYLDDGNGSNTHVRITQLLNSTHLQVKQLFDGQAETGLVGFDSSHYSYEYATLDGSALGAGNYDATVIAHTIGNGGNGLNIRLIGDSTEGARASLALGPETVSGHLDTVIEATSKGTAGNSITFAALGDLTQAAKAFKAFGTVGTGVFDTVIEAVSVGTAGNSITVALTGTGIPASGVVIGRIVNAFTITYEPGSTIGDIEDAIDALTGGDALIEVKTYSATPGTAPTPVVDDFTATNLANGLNHQAAVTFVRTGTDFVFHYESAYHTPAHFEATIAALAGADDIIQIKVNSSHAGQIITAPADDIFIPVNLAGGINDGGVSIVRTGKAFVIHYESGVSTVGDVNTAITALSGANDLFDVDDAGTIATVLTSPGDDSVVTYFGGGQTPILCMPRQLVRVNPKYVKRSFL